MAMEIKILSQSTINKIAAGEVIERPASVVKELLENAIDAGADEINITLENAGKNLILVSDNGKGMKKDELILAVKRHATSKLDEDNLMNINSFGFRGEALPSIAAISKFAISSKKNDTSINDNIGHKLSIINGEEKEIEIISSNYGTCVEVRDLFFATPARLKFLRSDRTELNVILNLIKRIAISHPHISFSMFHEGKNLLKVKKNIGNFNDCLNIRVRDIIGTQFIENSLLVSFDYDKMGIFGYVSLPTFNRSSPEDQFLYVNNRHVKDKIFNSAMKIAYTDFLPKDKYAVGVLFLTIDTNYVDVNVHPAKTEVRFRDPSKVRSLIINSINIALTNNGIRVSSTISNKAINYIGLPDHAVQDQQIQSLKESSLEKDFDIYKKNKNISNDKNFFKNDFYQLENGSNFKQINLRDSDRNFSKFNFSQDVPENLVRQNSDISEKDVNFEKKSVTQDFDKVEFHENFDDSKNNQIENLYNQKKLFLEKPSSNESQCDINNENLYPLGVAKAQLHKTYILSQTYNGFILVDQHAAHERIGYEKIKQYIKQNNMIKQRLLIPSVTELPDENRADLIYEYKEELSKLGLTIEKFGDKSIIVTEVPQIIKDANIERLILDIADHLLDIGYHLALTELIEHITETYACHYAIRAGRKMNFIEMNELLRQIENTPHSGQCNHGRPTYIELKLKDIEKLFGRK